MGGAMSTQDECKLLYRLLISIAGQSSLVKLGDPEVNTSH